MVMRPLQRRIIAIIGNGAKRLAVLDVNFVAPIGIGVAAATHTRLVGLHQGAKPFAHLGIDVVPLTTIARPRGCHQHHQRQHDQEFFHVLAPAQSAAGPSAGSRQPSRQTSLLHG